MLGWFTAKPPPQKKAKSVIHENGGTFVLDPSYAQLGEKEGWLTYTGYYTLNGQLYLTYCHSP